MLPRESLLGILGSLPDSDLLKAMSAVGIQLDPAMSASDAAGAGEEGGDDGDDSLVSWNNTDVKIPQTQRKPLFDKTKLFEKEPPANQPGSQPQNYYSPDQAGENISPYAANA